MMRTPFQRLVDEIRVDIIHDLDYPPNSSAIREWAKRHVTSDEVSLMIQGHRIRLDSRATWLPASVRVSAYLP